jgi:tripartite-type tricarboxylate transporter receptor subunit TctC
MRTIVTFLTALCAFGAHAQTYPAKPIRLILGYAPGGSADYIGRVMANEMGKDLGAQVVVENLPGAGGNIAYSNVARAPADGYTILIAMHPVINKVLYKSVKYDANKGFIPVSRVATGSTVIVVRKDLPVKNLKELIAYSKKSPNRLFSASTGVGSAPHLAAAVFESVTGVKFESVHYKGGGPAAVSIMAGETDVMFAVPPTVTGFIKSGRMRALALSQSNASPALPGIPGTQEAGLPGYNYSFWYGMFVPAGTPETVVKQLHEAATKALAKPEVREKIALQGMEATPSASPVAFDREVKAEAPVLERMLHDAGVQAE